MTRKWRIVTARLSSRVSQFPRLFDRPDLQKAMAEPSHQEAARSIRFARTVHSNNTPDYWECGWPWGHRRDRRRLNVMSVAVVPAVLWVESGDESAEFLNNPRRQLQQ
uniref:Uncharacterized protein n=1 Tax=Plectus sambesii TaxID=2011161 RepID=A0A914VTZ6_9BILA